MPDTYEVAGLPFDLKVRATRTVVSLIAIKSADELITIDIPSKRLQEVVDTLQYMADIR